MSSVWNKEHFKRMMLFINELIVSYFCVECWPQIPLIVVFWVKKKKKLCVFTAQSMNISVTHCGYITLSDSSAGLNTSPQLSWCHARKTSLSLERLDKLRFRQTLPHMSSIYALSERNPHYTGPQSQMNMPEITKFNSWRNLEDVHFFFNQNDI